MSQAEASNIVILFQMYVGAGNVIAMIITGLMRDYDNPNRPLIYPNTFEKYMLIMIAWPIAMCCVTYDYLRYLLRSAKKWRQKKKRK